MKRIFLEGLPGAGKSTLVTELERRSVPVVHELGKVLGVDAFPGNGISVAEILNIDDWFIAQEMSRMQSMEAVYDRSYLTHLTYAHGYGRYMNLPSFEPTVDKYSNALKKGRLELPTAIMYMDIEPDASIERQRIRSGMGVAALDSFWEDKDYLASLREAYDALLDSCDNIAVIQLDGSQDTSSLADETEVFIREHFASSELGQPKLKLGKYVTRLLEQS